MSTSDAPIPRAATLEEAMAALSDDPTAYNLPANADEKQVQTAKETAAANLVAGSAANAAYWNSRSELEQFVARAQGHGKVVAPPEGDTPTGVEGPTATDGGTVEGTASPTAEVPQTTAPGPVPTAPAEGEPAATAPSESPDQSTEVPTAPAEGEPAATAPSESPDQSTEDRLRAQLRAEGLTPEV